MRILFDQGTPVPLRGFLAHHEVATAFERGWSTLKNGELLEMAERQGFDVLVTTDSHLRDQQNLSNRRIAVVCLLSTSWPRIQQVTADVVAAIEAFTRQLQRGCCAVKTVNHAFNRTRECGSSFWLASVVAGRLTWSCWASER